MKCWALQAQPCVAYPLATATARRIPAFAQRLAAESKQERTASLDATHPDYDSNVTQWEVMLDAFEGTGGFQSGEYLWCYRNETSEDFVKRQKMARYHNYVETVIDLYVQQVFTQEPDRQTKSETLREWWKDVDGHGMSMTAFLRRAVALALSAGHVGILMDKTADAPAGPVLAEDLTRPFLALYTAPFIPDWRLTRGVVTGIKLWENVPDQSIADKPAVGDAAFQTLLWDEEGWARFDSEGEIINADVPGLGLVPFEVLRPKQSVTRAFIGRPLFSNANLVKALFNRMSELDEVARNQGFSMLTCEVSDDGDVEQAKKALGSDLGTTRALVAKGHIKYEAPDMAVVQNLGGIIDTLVRELYRVAHMRYERDSLQAESAEAIRLQFKELNEFLQGLAAELQRVERRLAQFYFAWTSPTPEAAMQAFEQAQVVVNYPEEFFLQDLRLDLDGWAQAIAMDLGSTMTKIIKKKAARRVEPELTPEDQKRVESEIDKQPDQASMLAQGLADTLRRGSQTRLKALEQTTSGGARAGDPGA